MFLQGFFDYKNQLMKDLCSNKEIVSLLTHDEDPSPIPNPGLAYDYIYPYEYVPPTLDDAKTLICFDSDVIDVPNKTFVFSRLYIWIIAEQSELPVAKDGVSLGLRTDRISYEIDKMLNGNMFYGMGRLELESATRFKPADRYQGRLLTYTIKEWNRGDNKYNSKIPSKRLKYSCEAEDET